MNRLNSVLKNISDKKAVLFIGAGVSSMAGCYNWNQIIEEFTKHQLVQDVINRQESVPSSLSNDEWIDYFEDLFKKNNKENEFLGILHKAIIKDINQYSNAYVPFIQSLKKITPFPRILTTNIDDCLEETGLFDLGKIYYEEADLVIIKFTDEAIFHIHGYKLNFKDALWTRRRYIPRYNNANFVNFLKEVFAQYSVIFLGYGLTEESLRNIIYQAKSVNPATEHFALISTDNDRIPSTDIAPYKDLYRINIIHYGKTDEFRSLFSQWIDANFVRVQIEQTSDGANVANA